MPDIGIVTTPSASEDFIKPVHNFVSILRPTADQLTLFTGGTVPDGSSLHDQQIVTVGDGEYLGVTLLDYVFLQMLVSIQLVKHRGRLDVVYFHKGTMGLLLPVLCSRLLGLHTCQIKVGAFHEQRVEDPSLVDEVLAASQRVAFRIADAVVVFSESEAGTVPNENVFVAFSNFRDFEAFDRKVPLEDRPIDVGFVGRFTEVKGVLQVARAAVSLVESHPELRVHLVGDGPQYDQVERLVSDHDRITLGGWVDPKRIATEYNRMKVLIAPSRAEGLPTGLIEAMGCGTVVVTTPVGSIGDLIEDGETGFHLSGRSPETIKRTYDRVSERDDLAAIGERARRHVVATYSRQAARDQFATITRSLLDQGCRTPGRGRDTR